MKYKHYIFKRRIEDIIIWPFVLLGKCIAYCRPLKQSYDVFFFFPFYHTGGAEKVHALITATMQHKKCIVFFTRKSVDQTFLPVFQATGATLQHIDAFTDQKWLYFNNLIYRGIVAGYIHQQKQAPVVLNGQCNFAYKLSPWLHHTVKQIELIHSFNTFSWIRLPFLPFYTNTVMISKVRIQNHLDQYKQIAVPTKYNNRIQYICNGIELPATVATKDYTKPLHVLYVGRGTPEKRVELVAAIAAAVHQQHPQIQFTIAGDVGNAIPPQLLSHCTILGNIHQKEALAQCYAQAHIAIITSNTEGFPMVVMEGMSYGCAILATPVGDLPVHVQQHVHGFISSSIDAALVVQEMTEQILAWQATPTILANMEQQNKQYAQAHFDIALFQQAYQALLQPSHQPTKG